MHSSYLFRITTNNNDIEFSARTSTGLTTRLTRLQPRAPDFLGAPKRPHPRKGLNEFSLVCEIPEIMKIVLVQFL